MLRVCLLVCRCAVFVWRVRFEGILPTKTLEKLERENRKGFWVDLENSDVNKIGHPSYLNKKNAKYIFHRTKLKCLSINPEKFI